jgi:hypothetical protein
MHTHAFFRYKEPTAAKIVLARAVALSVTLIGGFGISSRNGVLVSGGYAKTSFLHKIAGILGLPLFGNSRCQRCGSSPYLPTASQDLPFEKHIIYSFVLVSDERDPTICSSPVINRLTSQWRLSSRLIGMAKAPAISIVIAPRIIMRRPRMA